MPVGTLALGGLAVAALGGSLLAKQRKTTAEGIPAPKVTPEGARAITTNALNALSPALGVPSGILGQISINQQSKKASDTIMQIQKQLDEDDKIQKAVVTRGGVLSETPGDVPGDIPEIPEILQPLTPPGIEAPTILPTPSIPQERQQPGDILPDVGSLTQFPGVTPIPRDKGDNILSASLEEEAGKFTLPNAKILPKKAQALSTEDIELYPERANNIIGPAFLQDGKVLGAEAGKGKIFNHADIAQRLGFPDNLIPGFIDKNGDFLFQFEEDLEIFNKAKGQGK